MGNLEDQKIDGNTQFLDDRSVYERHLRHKTKVKWFEAITPVLGFVSYFSRNDMDNERVVFNAERLLTYNLILYGAYEAFIK